MKHSDMGEREKQKAEMLFIERQIFKKSGVLNLRNALFPTTREWPSCP